MKNGTTRGVQGIFNNGSFAMQARLKPRKPAARQKASSHAVARAAIETLEHRQLLSTTPVLTISGSPTTSEGQDYVLGLSASAGANLTGWTINWGDATGAQAVSAALTTVSHQYADATAPYHITATGTDGTNTYTANVGSSSATGALDVNFGSSGTVTTAGAAAGTAVAVQSDGKLIVVGSDSSGAIAVSRYNVDGTLDTSFGSGGTVTKKVGNADNGTSVAIQADGKIVVGGATGVFGPSGLFNRVEVLRFNADGSPDTTFAASGVFSTTFVSPTLAGGIVNGVKIDTAGRIVLAGTAGGASASQVFAGRLNIDGTPDLAFGVAGTGFSATQYAAVNTLDGGNALAIQPDGSIVIAGTANLQPAIVRFTANGTVDTGFGVNGWVVASGAGGNGSLASVAIDGSGRIVAAGAVHNQWGLVRVTSNGTLDSTFGINSKFAPGIDTRAPGPTAAAYGIAIQTDGQILVTGASDDSGATVSAFATERYNPDGSPDPSFGINGIVKTNFGSASGSLARSMLIRPDGRIVVTGQLGATLAMEQFDVGTGAATPVDVAVNDVSPVIDLSSVPATSAEGTPITTFATVTDPDPTEITNGWTVSLGSTVVASGPGTAINFAPADNGAYVVSVTSNDIGGASAIATTTINVTNVAPSVSLNSAPASGVEGTPIAFSAIVTDPSTADVAAGITDAWIVTSNGATVAQGTGVNVSFTPADNGAYVINFTATDKDGGSSSSTATVNVTNVAPVAVISGDTTGVRGQARHLSLSAIDPSSADTAAGFTFNINWGDGSAVQVVKPGDSLNPGHVYSYDGTYHISVTATDKDRATSAPVTTDIAISPLLIQGTTLSIGGLTADDILQFTQSSGPGGVKYLKLTDDFILKYKLDETTFTRIDLYQTDADTIFISNNISVPIYLVDANGVILQTLHLAH